MKKKIFRWLKFIGLLAVAAVCLCGFLFGSSEAVSDYRAWQDSFHSAERLCKHVDSFFLSVNILILSGGFLLLSIDGILRLFRKSERSPSPLWQRIQIYIVCFSLVLFVILRLWSRDAAARMGTTIEDGDTSYRLHLLCGWLDIGQWLAFWGILIPAHFLPKKQDTALAKNKSDKAQNLPVEDSGKVDDTMGLLEKLFKRKDSKGIEEKPELPKAPIAEHPPLTQWVTYGRGEPVYFIDESRGIQKPIVDPDGNICSFPGFVQEDLWVSQVDPCYLKPLIRFCTSFERRGDRLIMLWEIQPDGRYWEDEDGFGGTSDAEVTLYTFLDENGDFTGPFRVYRIGAHDYYKPEG